MYVCTLTYAYAYVYTQAQVWCGYVYACRVVGILAWLRWFAGAVYICARTCIRLGTGAGACMCGPARMCMHTHTLRYRYGADMYVHDELLEA